MIRLKSSMISRWPNTSIRTKMKIGIFGFTLLFLLISAVTIFITAQFYFHQKARQDLRMLGNVLADNSGAALVFNDTESARKVLNALRENPAVVGAAIFKVDELDVFAEYPSAGAAEKLDIEEVPPGVRLVNSHYITSVPVTVNGDIVGHLILKSNLDEWLQLKTRLRNLFLILFGGTILLTLLVSNWLKKQIVRPITSLSEWAMQVSRHKDFDVRAEKHYNDEIGQLVTSLNTMLEQLAKQDVIVRLNDELEKEVQERRAIEKDLIDTRDRAEEANRAKSRFLANMSHELRTPLNAIIGYSEMLQEVVTEDDFDREELVGDIAKVRGAGKHLLSLINDILDISKIEAGKMQISIEAFNADQLITEVVDALQPLAEKQQNRLTVKQANPVGFIRSDQVKVRQILFNLLSNAVKFTRNGTVEVRYEESTEGDSRWVVFRIRDTGIGISEAALAELFEPFSQADPSTTRKYGGTGLGLAISRSFVRMLGGEISVDSQEDKGSEFIVRLPVMSAVHMPVDHADADPLAGNNAKENAQVFGGELSEIIRKLPGDTHLLLIDDDPDVHDILGHSLKKQGFYIHSALSGHEGLELAAEIAPDVIVLDIFMPNMDGWQVLKKLKTNPATANIPVTLYTIESDEAKGYALGASDYLIKPIASERLLDVLARYRKINVSTKVLSIDDDTHSQQLVKTYLSGPEWNVVAAENGRDGFAKLGQNPDTAIILLDLIMPEMNGFEFLEAYKKKNLDIPVIVISARDLTTEESRLLIQHTQTVIRKGMYDKGVLINQIRKVLTVNSNWPTGDISS